MHRLSAFLDVFVDFAATGTISAAPGERLKDNNKDSSSFRRAAAKQVVAIGDLHGDLDAAKRAFRTAGLVDRDGHWIAGSTVCVQVRNYMYICEQRAQHMAGGRLAGPRPPRDPGKFFIAFAISRP
jgi:hypothetical protein